MSYPQSHKRLALASFAFLLERL